MKQFSLFMLSSFLHVTRRSKALAALLLFLTIQVSSTFAQNYPVDAKLRIFSPFSPAFYTFGSTGAPTSVNKIQLVLTLQDPLKNSLDIGLRWEIKCSQGNFKAVTPLMTAPVTLQKGVPKLLNNTQLTAWFDPSAFPGLPLQDGNLPEGDYEICVTAYELINESKASEQSCAYMYVTEFDPPDLVIPQDSLLPQYPQSVQVMWQPLHPGGFPVAYTLEIWEDIPGMTSEQVIGATPPFFVKEINQVTSTFLTAADPQLHIGQYYTMRVTIRDQVAGPGGNPVYVFKNQGHSPIKRFKYGYFIEGLECTPPSEVQYTLVGQDQRAYVYWDGGQVPGSGGTTTTNSTAGAVTPRSSGEEEEPPIPPYFNSFYTVKWHQRGTDTPWESATTVQKWWEIAPYKRGKTYEVVVVKACSDQELVSDTLRITFSALPPERPYECGMPPLVPDTTQITPLPMLKLQDTIIANDTRVIISKVSGSNGQFSGEGYFAAPLIKRAKIAVEFDNITVNDEYRMVQGEIITKFDPTGSNILSLDSLFNLLNGDEFTVPEITLSATDTAYYDANGSLVVIQNGTMSTYPQPLVVHTPAGSSVFSGGYVMPIWEGFEEPDGITPGFHMKFSKTNKTLLGFDSPDDNPGMDDRYEEFSNEAIPYKCTARGGPDELMGTVPAGNVPLEDIKVYTEHGATLVTEVQGSQLIIHVAGVEPTEMVYAMVGDTCLGAFYQVAYEATNYKVHLVSVNGAGADIDIESLQKTINTTLVQGACLTTLDRSSIALTDTSVIIDAESRLMTVYSADMNRIIDDFNTAYGGEGPSPIEFYLFLVNNLEGEVQGFMPEGTNYGFIDISQGDYKKTIPHELGHGAFTLRHYWEDYGGNQETMKNNLMDYSPAGTTLLYDQWNTMHDPRIPVPWIRGDDDAALGEGEGGSPSYIIELTKLMQANGITEFYYKSICHNDNSLKVYYHGIINSYAINVSVFYGSRPSATSFEPDIANFNSETELVYFIVKKNNIWSTCPDGTIWQINLTSVCDGTAVLDRAVTNEELSHLFYEFVRAGYTLLNQSEVELYTYNLLKFKEYSGAGKAVDVYYKGQCYRLNADNKIEWVPNPISDSNINNGTWTDPNIDVYLRFYVNGDGVIQYKALGIRSTLPVLSGKTVDLVSLAEEMKEQANAFFSDDNKDKRLCKVDDTPLSRNKLLNNENEVYADGDKMNIKESSPFLKIAGEGIDIVTDLLKTGEVVDKVYLESKRSVTSIHTPGLVSGATEAGASSLTDLTSLASLTYSLCTDKKARTDMYKGLVQIKEKVQGQPLNEVASLILGATTGNSSEEWAEVTNPATDSGRKSHLGMRGGINSVKSIFAAATLGAAVMGILTEGGGKLARMVELKLKHPIFADELLGYNFLDDVAKSKLIDDVLGEGGEALAAFFEGNVGRVKAWKKVDFHNVRLNTTFLGKVSDLPVNLQDNIKTLYTNLKYPKGFQNKVNYDANINGTIVHFDGYGFPNFTSHSPGVQFKFDQSNYPAGFDRLKGDGTDFTKANNWAVGKDLPGFEKLPNGQCKINGVTHTWHHHQDGRTMFPVPSDLHNVTNHSGGKAVLAGNLEDIFDPPTF